MTFQSVSQALRFEKLALSRGIAVTLIPVPRIISSSCGIAARFSEEILVAVTDLVAVEGEAMFHFFQQGNKLRAEQLRGYGEKSC